MEIKKSYDEYWFEKKDKDSFGVYERNLVLPPLFAGSKRVLDLACGDGEVSEFLKNKMGLSVIGIDFSKEAIKKAKSRGIEAICVDVEAKLPFKDSEFDTVFWGDNVEHLFNPEETLKEINRVLKRGGKLILSCPNMGYWRHRFTYLFNGALADTEWSGNPPWAWHHIRFFNPKTLGLFLKTQGLSINRILGVSKRLPDRYLTQFFPGIFAMIMVVEAYKR